MKEIMTPRVEPQPSHEPQLCSILWGRSATANTFIPDIWWVPPRLGTNELCVSLIYLTVDVEVISALLHFFHCTWALTALAQLALSLILLAGVHIKPKELMLVARVTVAHVVFFCSHSSYAEGNEPSWYLIFLLPIPSSSYIHSSPGWNFMLFIAVKCLAV